jgi:uncharacterized iron-regulated protein
MVRLVRFWLAFSGLVMGACAATPPASRTAPVPHGVTAAAKAAAPAAAADARWLTQLDREHALVGKIWDVKARAFASPSDVDSRLAAARFVLLGERHDNPDHHRLQGRMIEQLVKAGRRPAVVFEMLELEQQPAIDEYVARPDANATGFGTALGWEKTSWPPFKEYQPIFDAAFAGHLKILAGNLAHADAKALVKQGASALSPERAQALWLTEPFPPPLQASLIDELRASHCGKLPENLLEPMALAQHARDAQMATLLAGTAAAGAVLIAGGGHARTDRGVPYYLAKLVPDARVVSLSFREVRHGELNAEAYVADEGPFDFIWFTPRGSDDDPCAAFAK